MAAALPPRHRDVPRLLCLQPQSGKGRQPFRGSACPSEGQLSSLDEKFCCAGANSHFPPKVMVECVAAKFRNGSALNEAGLDAIMGAWPQDRGPAQMF